MKKSLDHIFDEANAREIERLVDQNAAPDVSADTLASIKNKVYAKTGIAKRKKKKSLIFRWQSYAAAAACLCLVVGLMFGTGVLKIPSVQAEEADEKTEEETNLQEIPEGFDHMVFLTENNHLILQTQDDVIMDVDFEYVWEGDQSETEYAYISVHYGYLFEGGNIFAPKKYAQNLLNEYFSSPIPLKKVISGDEREHMITVDDFPRGSYSLRHHDQDLEDGVDYFVFTLLEDGTVKFIDSKFNVYVSEKGCLYR